MTTSARWLALLPFTRFTRADTLTLVLFVTLGPFLGMLLFGLFVAGLNGMIAVPFWFALGMAVLPKAAVLLMVLMGILPAFAGGLAAVAVRGLNRPLLHAMCAMVVGCGVQLLLLSPLRALDNQAELLIAAAVAAAICSAAIYRTRVIKS